jgi:hypothetical protein
MKLNDLPAQHLLATVDMRMLRDCAELIGRRLWRADKVQQWMVCVPELAMARASGGVYVPLSVCEAASGLIGNALLAMSREPEEARSSIDDMEVLVSTVSLLVPLAPDVRRASPCACRHHALACALATGALRGMLSAGI